MKVSAGIHRCSIDEGKVLETFRKLLRPGHVRSVLLFGLSGADLSAHLAARAVPHFGVNIESVTIVVTAFMLGLGLGSLAGGWLSKRRTFPVAAAAAHDRVDDRAPLASSR